MLVLKVKPSPYRASQCELFCRILPTRIAESGANFRQTQWNHSCRMIMWESGCKLDFLLKEVTANLINDRSRRPLVFSFFFHFVHLNHYDHDKPDYVKLNFPEPTAGEH